RRKRYNRHDFHLKTLKTCFPIEKSNMLLELFIRNFAIIDDLKISFSDGLTILSGETGAGKSIIISAISLLLGSRATAGLIRTDCETAELEALFHVPPQSRAFPVLTDMEIDVSEGLAVRRVISRNNRHKLYINGRISTTRVLNQITRHLAGISSQHAFQELLNEEQHLLILDQFAGTMKERGKLSLSYHEILPLIAQLKDLKTQQAIQQEQMERYEYERNSILSAQILPGEDENLDSERAIIKNAELLFQLVHGCVDELYNSENSIVGRLGSVRKRLDQAGRLDRQLAEKNKGIIDASYHLEDIAGELSNYLNRITFDGSRLNEIEERIDTLKRLKRKYGGSLPAVSAHLESTENKMAQVRNLSGQIAELKNKLAMQHDSLSVQAKKLSEKRKEAAAELARKVEVELSTLKMSGTRVEVLLQKTAVKKTTDPFLTTEDMEITENGIDRAEFLIAPNVGEALKPLTNIASGGELSRVVLALKVILTQKEPVGTVVFDEVDSGIGGGVAEIVGEKLSNLADYHQIICITHLAQIAKFGNHHFKIAKQVNSGRTRTVIERLDEAERVDEIARMLGGVQITPTAIDHALEMLKGPQSQV
ncbi:DNA repair protein RecN, partial [Desulfobacterales bacterium HSG16]|nr:DNA repair protein RecN [Desulfobacterales bacterium HSG16]